jgi:hypothetical protein
MILDADLQFSSAQDMSAASAASANIIDLGVARNIAVGKPMYIIVTVLTALTNTGSVTIKLETDDDVAFGSATNAQAVGVLTTSAAGTQLIVPIYPHNISERYMRLYFTKSGTVDAGTVDAFLSEQYEKTAYYADAVTIS